MHTSHIAHQPLAESLAEYHAQTWLCADHTGRREAAATALREMGEGEMGATLARVAFSFRGAAAPRDLLLGAIAKAFGAAVAGAFDTSFAQIVADDDVRVLLRDVTRDERLSSAAILFAEGSFDEAFIILRQMPEHERVIHDFVRLVGEFEGNQIEAAKWLALRYATS